MSLAATGGGGFSGGGAGLSAAAMAHNIGPGPGALAAQPAHQGIPGGGIPGGGGGAGPGPGSAAFAGAVDLLDKNQTQLSGRRVRAAAGLPLVAADVWGDGCHVAAFPPEEEPPRKGEDDDAALAARAAARVRAGVRARAVGGVAADVALRRGDARAYKAVKRYLNKGEGTATAVADAVVAGGKEDEEAVVLPRPHLALGARRPADLGPAARAALAALLPATDDAEGTGKSAAAAAIAQADEAPLALSTIAVGDEAERLAFQLRLLPGKKPMTMLPEEALALHLARCRALAREGLPLAQQGFAELAEDGDDAHLDYPLALAVPGWAAADAAVEALLDAAGGACPPTLHQRAVAAAAGALLPPAGGAAPSKLAALLTETAAARRAEAERAAAVAAAKRGEEPEEVAPFVPLVLLAGATAEGTELTAVQVTKPQGPDDEVHCPFGNISVVSSVCYARPLTGENLEQSLDELRAQVGAIASESEEPTVIVTYGSIASQLTLAKGLKKHLTKYGAEGQDDDDWDGWDQDIPIISTREECVALGLAVLGANAHGRVRVVVQVKGTDGKYRPRPKAGVAVQDAATCAVAVSFNYAGGEGNEKEKWTAPKVLFDFDRRVPAGPYQIDFTAAECAAHVQHGDKTGAKCIEDEDALLKSSESLLGRGGIPQREAAALRLRFRVYQRTSRGGEDDDDSWIQVGEDMRPLSMRHSQKDEGESGEYVAIESAVMEFSLSAVGLITTSVITNGETIVQANKSALKSKLLRYGLIAGSVLFFGGFLVKSYVEERIFERDTRRVLAYYKHAAPNSFHDGDERQARYLVWKYKGRKDRLWRRLESKYNVPVRHEWEWEDEEDKGGEGKEETEDLDEEEGEEEQKKEQGEEL